MSATPIVVWGYADILEEDFPLGPLTGERLEVFLIVDHPRWGACDSRGADGRFSSGVGVLPLTGVRRLPGGAVAGYGSEVGVRASLDLGKTASPPDDLIDPPLRIGDGTDPVAYQKPCAITVEHVDRVIRNVPGNPDATIALYRIEGSVR